VFSAALVDEGGGNDAIRWPPAVTPTCRNETCPSRHGGYTHRRASPRADLRPGHLDPADNDCPSTKEMNHNE
jgi:hypothetical protein